MFRLYIPDYVLPTDIDCIKYTFEKLNLAKVDKVEFVPHLECEYNCDPEPNIYGGALVYINYWFNNISVDHLKERIKDPEKEARIVYDDPLYWVLEQDDYDEDQDKLISNIKQKLDLHTNSVNHLYQWISNNNYNLSYLLACNRKEYIKRQKIMKREDNLKAQRRWKKRLRPRYRN